MANPLCHACRQHNVRHPNHVLCVGCWHRLDSHTQGDLIRSEKAWRAGKLGGSVFQSVRNAAIKLARAKSAVTA